jgi:hypothetical protein
MTLFDAQEPLEKSVSLTPRSIFWAIFAALWAFSLSAGLVYLILRFIFAYILQTN